jgi:hypothetical protein
MKEINKDRPASATVPEGKVNVGTPTTVPPTSGSPAVNVNLNPKKP